MRVAIAGTHRTGKSTLLQALEAELAGYTFVDEPYQQMVEDGFDFEEPPTVDEFFEQLRVSTALVTDSAPQTIFDRSPLDFLAYAQCVDRDDAVDLDVWLDLCREGVAALDAIILCTIEAPDRIAVAEHRKLRRRVDEALQAIILDDRFELLAGVTVVEVSGSVAERVKQALPLFAGSR